MKFFRVECGEQVLYQYRVLVRNTNRPYPPCLIVEIMRGELAIAAKLLDEGLSQDEVVERLKSLLAERTGPMPECAGVEYHQIAGGIQQCMGFSPCLFPCQVGAEIKLDPDLEARIRKKLAR